MINGKALIEGLKNIDVYDENPTIKGDVASWSFKIPQEMLSAYILFPKAVQFYLPTWVMEQFIIRTNKQIIITSLNVRTTGDTFIDHHKTEVEISGKCLEVEPQADYKITALHFDNGVSITPSHPHWPMPILDNNV